MTFDDEAWSELDAALLSNDPLKFVDKKPYAERLLTMQKSTGLMDALITGEGIVGGNDAESRLERRMTARLPRVV